MSRLAVTTWNVNSVRQRMEHLGRFLAEKPSDVLLLQETKVEDRSFPDGPLRDLGYEVVASGQKTWNGVAVISRLPVADPSESLPNGYTTKEKRILTVTVSGIRIVNVYVPNGGASEESFRQKLLFLDAMVDAVRGAAPGEKILLAGDFNVAPSEDDVYDPAALDGEVCFHPEERARMEALYRAGAVDLFRKFTPEGKSYSWWDYRQLGFQKNRGMRLDHILASPALAPLSLACTIDRELRKWPKPSDHAPVTAVFEIG